MGVIIGSRKNNFAFFSDVTHNASICCLLEKKHLSSVTFLSEFQPFLMKEYSNIGLKIVSKSSKNLCLKR